MQVQIERNQCLLPVERRARNSQGEEKKQKSKKGIDSKCSRIVEVSQQNSRGKIVEVVKGVNNRKRDKKQFRQREGEDR